MIQTLSENVIVPIVGLILAFIMTLEFIQIIIERNNLHDFEISNIYKWMFKTACATLIVTNTWNIVMAVFDISQSIVSDASGIMVSDAILDFKSLIPDLESRIICVAIYAALVQNIAVMSDISYAIWTCMGYTVLLCFSLFKTGSLSKALLSAH